MHETLSRTMLADVGASLSAAAEEVVPWFLAQLPDGYVHDIDPDTRRLHLAAVVGARATGVPPSVTLTSDEGRTVSVLRPHDRPGLLAELLKALPRDRTLHSARVYTARDQTLVLDVFRFGAPRRYDPADPDLAAKGEATLAWAEAHAPDLDRADVARYLHRCAAVFVDVLSPRRLVRYAALHRDVVGTAGVAVDAWDHADDPSLTTITLAVGEHDARDTFERVATVLGLEGLSVVRAYLDPLAPDDGDVALCAFVVQTAEGHLTRSPRWAHLARTLRRVPWVDDRVLSCVAAHPDLGLLRGEVVVALLDLVHVRLCRRDRFGFSRQRLADLVAPALGYLAARADTLRGVTPPTQPSLPRLSAEAREVVETFDGAVRAVRGHNLDRSGRYGLVLDVDPAWLVAGAFDATPHAVLYGRGKDFQAFHVRFRPIARGGLRAVLPRARDQHTLETERLFDEVYGLAWAQELKNKDIPEGGAKGVVIVDPEGSVSLAVKAFVDGMLDVSTAPGGPLLYLGPDERITVPLIEWIVERAHLRGYPQPLAFMSSKPGAGINHKVYGVTSEGVAVFLTEALKARGKDPATTPFSVKLTGGPDGDVAGNMIRILHRDQGDRVRFVGIADGSGCAEDPDGLDLGELLRLVDADCAIADFDADRLGPRGRLTPVTAPDGAHVRDTMCFRVHADAFVPAGGRPRTMHAGNWRAFLDAEGRPTSTVIVEGANLFLTPEARTALSEVGVTVVKDSSANKCGVICSSFEIAASMLLDAPAFLEVKDAYVADVLVRLQAVARAEARVLLGAADRWPEVPLPDLSVRLSRVILRTTDAIANAYPALPPESQATLRALVREHLPASLVDRLGPDLVDDLPEAYVVQTVACSVATRMAYREGLAWLEGREEAELVRLALRYVDAEREVVALADGLEGRGERRAAALLRRSGVRAALASDGDA